MPLPFAEEQYLRDFGSEQSRARFRELLSRAAEVVVLPATTSRQESYAQVGRYVVEHCDVLLALWDGQPTKGRGGTAETVAYAAAKGVSVVWVRIAREIGADLERGAPRTT